jgi:hypothetical protein
VIIGFGMTEAARKRIYDYEAGNGDEASIAVVTSVSPYLIEGGETVIVNRPRPLCSAPRIGIGNKPIDDCNYLFTPEQKHEFLQEEPSARRYFRRWVGSREFLNGIERWCLWLRHCPPSELRTMPHVMQRVRAVRKFRAASKSAPTQRLAATPTRFHVENVPDRQFLLIPKYSSWRRQYIPMGWIEPDVLVSDLAFVVPDATMFHFGILSSAMHMAWVRTVCGRIKSDYRYSKKLVYNNFPWPPDVAAAERKRVEEAAGSVLAARAQFPDATLSDLYDPLTMPRELHRAHEKLSRSVDRLYRRAPFGNDRERMEHLFGMWERLSSPISMSPSRIPARRTRKRPK